MQHRGTKCQPQQAIGGRFVCSVFGRITSKRLRNIRRLRLVPELFNSDAELARQRHRLSDAGLGSPQFPGGKRLAADAQSLCQLLLTEGPAMSNASDSAELGKAVHVAQMVTPFDAGSAEHTRLPAPLDMSAGRCHSPQKKGRAAATAGPMARPWIGGLTELTVPWLRPVPARPRTIGVQPAPTSQALDRSSHSPDGSACKARLGGGAA